MLIDDFNTVIFMCRFCGEVKDKTLPVLANRKVILQILDFQPELG